MSASDTNSVNLPAEETVGTKELKKETGERLRLLLVDDDPEIANLARLGLSKVFEVKVEEQGSKVLTTSERERPDVIILDLHMPHVDGFEVLAQLKTHPVVSGTPVICASADTTDESRSRAGNLGAIGFIKKPFKPKELARDIQQMLTSLNVKIESTDSDRTYSIVYNEAERLRLLKEAIQNEFQQGQKVLLVSWMDGEAFYDNQEPANLVDESLVYLQVKAALISKFPYLQELAPIVTDMISFLKDPPSHYTLIFDEPNLLFEMHGKEVGLAKIFGMSDVLSKSFRKTRYFSTRSRDERTQDLINQMAKVFVGKIRW
jgi:CheY-like chemotaxis protein